MRRGFYAFSILVLLLVAITSMAQGISEGIELRFDHLTVNNGLSHSDAMCVVEDDEGFVWIGTNKGVDRFNGNDVKNYAANTDGGVTSGFTSNRIRSLYVSPSNELWVGTENGGVSLYDRPHDSFIHVNEKLFSHPDRSLLAILANAHVTTVAEDAQGNIWIGTTQEGVFILDRKDNKFLRIKRLALTDTGFMQFGVRGIHVSAEGRVYIVTYTDGLYYQAQNHLVQVDFTVKPIQAVHMDKQGALWIAADAQIFKLSKAADKPVKVVGTFSSIECLHVDSFQKLWIGTGEGIFLISPNENSKQENIYEGGYVQHILPQEGNSSSLSYKKVHQIVEDKTQVIWIAANAGGVNKVDLVAKQFGYLQPQRSMGILLPGNYINAIWKEERKNLIWIGTRNGVAQYNPVTNSYRYYLNNPDEHGGRGVEIFDIFQDTQKNLWFANRDNGFFRMERNGNHEQWTTFTINDKREDASPGAVSIVEDRQGYIWMATGEDGIFKFNKKGQQLNAYQQCCDGLPTDRFTQLSYDSTNHVLWAATLDAGLLQLKIAGDSLLVAHHFTSQPADTIGLSVNYVWPMAQDKNGDLWIGTLGGGLHELAYDAAGDAHISRWNKLLPEQDVESIVLDDQGNLWIGGGGLWQLNPVTKKISRFEVSDGLQSNSFKVGAATKAQDGTLYFGGINGVNYFHPNRVKPNPYAPSAIISDFRIFSKSVGINDTLNGRVLLTQNLRLTKEITIHANENDFSIDFIAFHYANPGKIVYAYKLKGYHKDWVYPPTDQRTASFSNLPAGDYTFLLKAGNSDGKWSGTPTQLGIHVLPPWWKTIWAYAGMGLALIGIFVWYQRAALAQQNLKNSLAMEKVMHGNDQKLNELKLRFFTNISHELRTPLTLILGPMEELTSMTGKLNGMSDKIFMMHKQTRKLLDLVNQLMDFRKADSEKTKLKVWEGDLVKFLYEIYCIFKPKADEKNIHLSFHSDAEEVLVYFDRNKLEIVITNLISNALKYTPENGTVDLSLACPSMNTQRTNTKGDYIQIELKDSGIGIDETGLEKIFDVYYQAAHTETLHIQGTGIGLSLTKQIVDQHGGEIKVTSKQGQGTHFRLRLKTGKEHFSPTEVEFNESSNDTSLFHVENRDRQDHSTAYTNAGDIALLSTAKLLIVEDNEDVALYLQALFRPYVNVLTASNGEEAWVIVNESFPNLVLSDIMMPVMSGLDLCKMIKSNQRTMHIPVVLLTARAAAIHELEGLETGADDYLTKPFNPTLLKAKVLTLITNKRKVQEYYQKQLLMQPTEIVIPDADKYLLEEAMRSVENHLEDSGFNVQQLVNELGMSTSGFYRRIKSITGLSPVEFLRDVKMKRAAQLLREGSLRVSEISYKVGIEDVKHFRKSFQKTFNISPSEYAKANGQHLNKE